MKIVNNLLVHDEPSPIIYKSAGHKKSGLIDPKFLVIHYTAGTSFEGDMRVLSSDSTAKVSCHLVIGPEGQVGQIGNFRDALWHAGQSNWKGYSGLNKYSIGIEVTCPGYLTRVGKDAARTDAGKVIVDDEPYPFIEGRHTNPKDHHTLWAGFTEKQVELVREIGILLMDTYDLEEAVGHDQIAPDRKLDPGPSCPQSVFAFLNGNHDNLPGIERPDLEPISMRAKYKVGRLPAGEKLNCRAEPRGRVIGSLPEGTSVEIIQTTGDWAQIRTPWTGTVCWVYLDYLIPPSF